MYLLIGVEISFFDDIVVKDAGKGRASLPFEKILLTRLRLPVLDLAQLVLGSLVDWRHLRNGKLVFVV